MDNIIAVIQARMNSSRLHNKVLKKINGKSILDILVNRVKKCKNIKVIVVATTKNDCDVPIVEYCQTNNINYIIGNEIDVYSRFKLVTEKYNCYNLCRLTCDNPLYDYEYIDEQINIFNNNNYDLLTLIGSPIGITCFEIINMKKLIMNENLIIDRENFTSIIYENKIFNSKINILNINHPLVRKNDLLIYIRLTVDTMEDFVLIEKILTNFKGNEYDITLIDILNFLEKNKDLIDINNNSQKYHYNYFFEKLNKVKSR
jgi:spore coat polysaccharide biosynthesis protein SpsF